jgi:predicted ribosome quality control (RQC) complex YloA/Tae2 family protein
MTTNICPRDSCKKEFETPVVVTNFSATPKQTYHACPYCLTRIEITVTETETDVDEPVTKPDQEAIRQKVLDALGPQKTTFESIKKLEKEKAELLAQLEQLRKGAEQRISDLEQEVFELRQEAESLKQLIKD